MTASTWLIMDVPSVLVHPEPPRFSGVLRPPARAPQVAAELLGAGLINVTHAFQSLINDDPNIPQAVRPSNWNANHALSGPAGTMLGFDSSGNGTSMPVSGGGIYTIPDLPNQTFDALNGATLTARISAASISRTLVPPVNPVDGQRVVIEHTALGAPRTLTLMGGAGGFLYGAGASVLGATAANTTDEILVIYNAAQNRWRVSAVVQGF